MNPILKVLAWCAGLFAFALIAAMAVGMSKVGTPESQAKQADRDMIARCVKARDDELSELSTRRMMRQACIQMDAEFQAKWGIASREL